MTPRSIVTLDIEPFDISAHLEEFLRSLLPDEAEAEALRQREQAHQRAEEWRDWLVEALNNLGIRLPEVEVVSADEPSPLIRDAESLLAGNLDEIALHIAADYFSRLRDNSPVLLPGQGAPAEEAPRHRPTSESAARAPRRAFGAALSRRPVPPARR